MSKPRPGSPRARLFLALELPEQTLVALESWRSVVYAERADLRLPGMQSLHVTLVFLGYRAKKDIESIAALCFADPPGPLSLTPVALAGVPGKRPRLHALELRDGGSNLCSWQRRISQALSGAGLYEPEKRPFWPHLTIARAKRGKERETARGAIPELPARLQRPIAVRRATLFSSTLKPSGAVYEALASIDLK